jgi:hypothetical protein
MVSMEVIDGGTIGNTRDALPRGSGSRGRLPRSVPGRRGDEPHQVFAEIIEPIWLPGRRVTVRLRRGHGSCRFGRNVRATGFDATFYERPLTVLAAARMRVSVYNLPLCVVPDSVRPFAVRSISDWKNAYPAVCAPCGERGR